MFEIAEYTLTAQLAASGTITVNYPTGFQSGHFRNAPGALVVTDKNDVFRAPTHFTLTLNAASFVVNWAATAPTIAAGTKLRIQLPRLGADKRDDLTLARQAIKRAIDCPVMLISLGAPITADIDSMIDAATGAELPNAATKSYTPATNGTSPTDGVQTVVTLPNGVKAWELDVPRNIVITTTHGTSIVAMTFNVTGYDEYGVKMYETLSVTATGTTKTSNGLKAFKWVTQIDLVAAADATANTVEVGFGDVLGLPVFMQQTTHFLKELQDGAAATAGTFVAGVQSVPSATTGDVRGTYDPNAAADGSRNFELLLMVPEPQNLGLTQYSV